MALQIHAKFEGKLTRTSINDTRNLFGKFSTEHSKVSKVGTLMGYIYPKQKMYELKVCKGVMFHSNKE